MSETNLKSKKVRNNKVISSEHAHRRHQTPLVATPLVGLRRLRLITHRWGEVEGPNNVLHHARVNVGRTACTSWPRTGHRQSWSWHCRLDLRGDEPHWAAFGLELLPVDVLADGHLELSSLLIVAYMIHHPLPCIHVTATLQPKFMKSICWWLTSNMCFSKYGRFERYLWEELLHGQWPYDEYSWIYRCRRWTNMQSIYLIKLETVQCISVGCMSCVIKEIPISKLGIE